MKEYIIRDIDTATIKNLQKVVDDKDVKVFMRDGPFTNVLTAVKQNQALFMLKYHSFHNVNHLTHPYAEMSIFGPGVVYKTFIGTATSEKFHATDELYHLMADISAEQKAAQQQKTQQAVKNEVNSLVNGWMQR